MERGSLSPIIATAPANHLQHRRFPVRGEPAEPPAITATQHQNEVKTEKSSTPEVKSKVKIGWFGRKVLSSWLTYIDRGLNCFKNEYLMGIPAAIFIIGHGSSTLNRFLQDSEDFKGLGKRIDISGSAYFYTLTISLIAAGIFGLKQLISHRIMSYAKEKMPTLLEEMSDKKFNAFVSKCNPIAFKHLSKAEFAKIVSTEAGKRFSATFRDILASVLRSRNFHHLNQATRAQKSFLFMAQLFTLEFVNKQPTTTDLVLSIVDNSFWEKDNTKVVRGFGVLEPQIREALDWFFQLSAEARVEKMGELKKEFMEGNIIIKPVKDLPKIGKNKNLTDHEQRAIAIHYMNQIKSYIQQLGEAFEKTLYGRFIESFKFDAPK